MAVASFNREGKAPIIRGFDPPKTSSITHWYKAAVQIIPEAPNWRNVLDALNAADISEESIIIHGDTWSLFIARKRFLKT